MKKTEIDVVKQLENKRFHKNYTPIIIITIVMTFVIIFTSVWLLCAHLIPAKVGDIAYKLNLNEYALKLYERDYDSSGDINSLYMALNVSIKIENDDKVIELFEEFYDRDEYYEYVQLVNEDNLKQQISPVIKSTMLNEDNALKNSYIKSLINKNKDFEAFDFAVRESFNMNPTYNDLGNYLFANFCKNDVVDRFSINFTNIFGSTTLVGEICNYMVAVNNEFLDFGFGTGENEVYVWAMGNRVLQVGNNLLTLCEKTGITVTNGENIVDNTIEIMDNVNKKFKLMSME